jgi:hypothetical protein
MIFPRKQLQGADDAIQILEKQIQKTNYKMGKEN